jgi:hypothetical protein
LFLHLPLREIRFLPKCLFHSFAVPPDAPVNRQRNMENLQQAVAAYGSRGQVQQLITMNNELQNNNQRARAATTGISIGKQ